MYTVFNLLIIIEYVYSGILIYKSTLLSSIRRVGESVHFQTLGNTLNLTHTCLDISKLLFNSSTKPRKIGKITSTSKSKTNAAAAHWSQFHILAEKHPLLNYCSKWKININQNKILELQHSNFETGTS